MNPENSPITSENPTQTTHYSPSVSNTQTNFSSKNLTGRESKENSTKVPTGKSFFRELVEFALIAVVIVIPFRIFIAQPFVVSGASMDPTFKNGEYLIVDQISYRFGTPARGSVLIFKYPKDTSKYFIKRVIGLPNETVKIKDGVVTIVNKAHPEGFTLNEPYIVFAKKDSFEMTLDGSEYFVLGDNRLGSADSRVWGPMPTEDIVGRPILRLFPISQAGIVPGDFAKTFTQ
jgi:signal peptidase I